LEAGAEIVGTPDREQYESFTPRSVRLSLGYTHHTSQSTSCIS
jgi:hypothetical protein